MKAERAEAPRELNGHRKGGKHPRPRRGVGTTTVGFGSVMQQARGGAAAEAQQRVAQLDAGRIAAHAMGDVQSVGELLADATSGVQSPVDALQRQDASPVAQAMVEPHVPSAIVRMTPAALLSSVADEARRLDIAEAMKELHIELEPADLGPVVVRLRKGPDGTLDIGFRARQGDAARVLEQGSELLRGRLGDAGFAAVRIDVAHDADLVLTGSTT